MCFRNLKKINLVSLAIDLQQLSSADFSSVTESVDFYNRSLSTLLDIHAPVKTRTVTFSRSAPWFTCELRKMKEAGRVLERRLKVTGLTVHRQAYREHQKAYAKSLRDARSRFYSGIINNSSGNSKQLFSTINHLLKPQAHPHLEATKERCDTFIVFFRKKVDNIRSFLSSSSALPVLTADLQPETPQPLCCFSDISQQEVEDKIRKMKPSTCTLDPFPTALVKSNLCAISPLITNVINHSLQAGHVPPELKTAVIRPHLKKPTLDPEVLANYRPISNLPFISKVLEKIVAAQLQTHLKQNNLFEKFQSGFRSGHSTETALVRVTNDLLMAADAGSPSLLILLDLTAAFDTVDHSILLYRLRHTISLSGSVYNWFHPTLLGEWNMLPWERLNPWHTMSPVVSLKAQCLALFCYIIHASSRLCHQPAWNIISLLCRRHSTLPKDQLIHFCCPVIFHHDYLSGGGRGLDEPKFSAVEWLKDWGYSSRHPSPNPDICYFQCYLFWPKYSTLNISYKFGC